MKIQWTSHLKTDEEKDRFEKSILGARHIFDRLNTLLDERLKAIELIETGVDKYKQPGWDAIQAHYNGAKAELKWIKQLTDLTDPEVKYGRQPIQ